MRIQNKAHLLLLLGIKWTLRMKDRYHKGRPNKLLIFTGSNILNAQLWMAKGLIKHSIFLLLILSNLNLQIKLSKSNLQVKNLKMKLRKLIQILQLFLQNKLLLLSYSKNLSKRIILIKKKNVADFIAKNLKNIEYLLSFIYHNYQN